MSTGYNFKQLTLVNFGDQNITRSKIFNQSPNSSSDPIIFEAIRSLLDHNYLNEKVTKPRDAESDSYVELTYEWKGREFKLKRVFGKDGRIILNGKVAKQIPDGLLGLQKPEYDTPSNITDQMMSELFRQRLHIENNLHDLVQNLWMSADKNMTFTLGSRSDIQNAIVHDLDLHGKIEKLEWKWILSRQNRAAPDAYYQEVKNIIPATPMDEFHFRDSLVNIFLASLQFNIAANQRDLYDHVFEEIDCECEAYVNETLVPHGWERILRAIAMSKKLEQHDAEQLDFYQANINIVSKYKEDFPTADAWEAEKGNMIIIEETQFHDELTHQERILTAAAEEVRQKLGDTKMTIRNLSQDMRLYDPTTIKTTLFLELKSYIFENVLVSLNDFSEVLCEVLNNPMLEIANISKGIAGSVHSIANNAEARLKPKFIFDHVSSLNSRRSEHLFNHLEPYLAPLSNVQFSNTANQAIEFMESIEREPNDESCKTTFTFAAYENISPGEAQARIAPGRPRLLTNIQREFGYNDTLTNLLSNCRITCDKKLTKKNSNLLNLATKRMARADNETAFVTESKYLFRLLRQIKNSYENIGSYLLDAKRFDDKFIRDAHDLQRVLNTYYNAESLLCSELMNRLRLNFEEHNIANQEQAIKGLTHRSASRMTIHGQLLSLQHTDGCDDSKFVETLSQRHLDTLEIELCEMNLSATFAIPHPDEVLYDFIRLLRNRQLDIKRDLVDVHEMWHESCIQLRVEPNEALSKRLSTISSIDFLLCSRYFSRFALRQRIPGRYRKNNNLSFQNIFDQIDRHVSQLYYPKGSSAGLERCKQILASSEKNRTITSNMSNMTGTLLSRYDYAISETLADLCARVTTAVASVMNNADYEVHCERINVPYDSLSCTAIIRRIHLYGRNGDIRIPDIDDVISIFIYVYFVRQFTESPIILDEIMEACDEKTLKAVLTFIADNVTDRFALVRNPNPNIDENRADSDPSVHSTEAMDVDEAVVDPGVDRGQGVERGEGMDVDDVQNERPDQNRQEERDGPNAAD
ncbi:uncharacterized protein LOC119074567 [Bradysia coprophila]|uniref:uncharacterized protein LOC119074567 n=1 Tax=Bradysia coprophila TaxID=38358 RepID=UPI00187DB5EC|nr:uncharacterized protein LOC119074567 [Bradysia coprophila]